MEVSILLQKSIHTWNNLKEYFEEVSKLLNSRKIPNYSKNK